MGENLDQARSKVKGWYSALTGVDLNTAWAEAMGDVEVPLDRVFSAGEPTWGDWIPLIPAANLSPESKASLGQDAGLWMQIYVLPDHNDHLPSLRAQLEDQAGTRRGENEKGSRAAAMSITPQKQPAPASVSGAGYSSASISAAATLRQQTAAALASAPDGYKPPVIPTTSATTPTASPTGEKAGYKAPATPPPAPATKPLPDGWGSAKDPASGKTYYFNRSTNKTQWERPGDEVEALAPPQIKSESASGHGGQAAYKPVVWGPAASTKPAQPKDLLDFGSNEAAPSAAKSSNQQSASPVDLLGLDAQTCVQQPKAGGDQPKADQLDLLDLMGDAGPAAPSAPIGSSAFAFVGNNSSSNAFTFTGSSTSQRGLTDTIAMPGGSNNSSQSTAFGFINQQAPEQKREPLNLEALYASTASAPLQQPSFAPSTKASSAFDDLDMLSQIKVN